MARTTITLRGAPRIVTAVRAFDANAPNAGTWLTRDLSAVGIFLLAPPRWQVGDQVDLVLVTPRRRLLTPTEVVHCQVEGVGMRCTDESPQWQRAFMSFLREQLKGDTWRLERRREHRRNLRRLVFWRDGEREHGGLMTVVSARGAYIESEKQPRLGDAVYLLLPDMRGNEWLGSIVGCRAQVTSRQQDGFGAEFVEPTEEFLAVLSRS